MFDVSATIVVYKNDLEILSDTVNSFLNTTLCVHLYIVDNSPTNQIGEYFRDERIEYMFQNSNKGFGAGHNVIMKQPNKMGKYHLVLNPDIKFNAGVLETIFEYMEAHPSVGNIIPRVIYPDGVLCPVCRLLPTPLDWIFRLAIPFRKLRNQLNRRFLLLDFDLNNAINAPFLSGCFMFLRRSAIEDIGVFDEHIFMYGEDTDLNRRIHRKYNTLYYPSVCIIHHGAVASHRNFRLMYIHIKSAVYYFYKWGWFFDKERKVFNTRVLTLYGKGK